MTIPQPLSHLTIDESLLTVKAEPELPIVAPEIKPFLISNSVTERFTSTIHKTKEISPSGIRKMQSGKIGALAYSESREVLLSRPASKSILDKTPSLTGILSDNRADSLTPLDDALDRELRSATCSTKNKLCGVIEEGTEPSLIIKSRVPLSPFAIFVIVSWYISGEICVFLGRRTLEYAALLSVHVLLAAHS